VLSPEKLFGRSWALTVLNRAMDKLQAEATSSKERRIFGHLKDCLTLAQDAVAYGDTKEQAIRRLRASLFFFNRI
jgi:hypothetical protein